MAQDFGGDFQFSSDQNALQSILSHKGVSYSQLVVEAQNRPSMTPAQNGNFSKSDQLEFFESKAGQIFFRNKVVAKKDHTPIRNPISRKKGGFGRSFRNLEVEHQLPKRMNMSNTKAGKFRTPLGNKNTSSDERPAALSDKKPSMMIPPIHRQSISERKPAPACGLPVPNHANVARKMLFNKPNPVPATQKLKYEVEHQFAKPSNILPPLTRLTRESFKHIPRESLAWMSQLPRESATFAELEKLMTDDDKKFANDDDTDSFEAMEKRMKTPSKGKLGANISKLAQENKENMNSLALEITSKRTTKVAPTREINASPTSSKPKSYKKKHELYGTNLSVGSSLTELSPAEVDNSIKATSAPNTPIKTSAPLSPLHISAPQTPILCQPTHSIGTPLTPGLKSLSTTDISGTVMVQSVQVARSASVANMAEVVSFSDLVATDQVEGLLKSMNEYQEQLNKFREEQDELLKQEEELVKKIKQRKQQFRELWGVSPLRINSKRTVLPANLFKQAEQKKAEDLITPGNKTDVGTDTHNMTPNIKINVMPPDTARRVRFNSGKNEIKTLTPHCTSEFPPEGSPLGSLNNSGVFDTSRSNSSNQSFASLKSSFSFLQTPLPPKKRLMQNMMEADHLKLPKPKQLVEPTPVALRKLSDRVKAEFAALYADSSDETDVDAPLDCQEKLSF